MRYLHLVVFALCALFSALVSSDETSENPYSTLLGVSVGQGFESVETYLRDELGLTDEHIKTTRMANAELDAAQAIIEVSAATVSLTLQSGEEPTMVPMDSIEIYFTYRTPVTDPPELMAHYITFRFPDEPSTREQISTYAVSAYDEPVIDDDNGYQWCLYLNDDSDACVSSCKSWDSTEACPPNLHVAFGDYLSGTIALTLVDWSAPSNYKLAVKARQ